MVQTRFPLGRTEQDRVQVLLTEGEQVRAAVVAFSGPRAGIVALLAPLLGLVSLLSNVGRHFTTIAVTTNGVVLLDIKGLRRPVRVRSRLPLDALGPINDTTGDSWIQVNGTKYWIEGIWSSQLHVMRQLMPDSTSPK